MTTLSVLVIIAAWGAALAHQVRRVAKRRPGAGLHPDEGSNRTSPTRPGS